MLNDLTTLKMYTPNLCIHLGIIYVSASLNNLNAVKVNIWIINKL